MLLGSFLGTPSPSAWWLACPVFLLLRKSPPSICHSLVKPFFIPMRFHHHFLTIAKYLYSQRFLQLPYNCTLCSMLLLHAILTTLAITSPGQLVLGTCAPFNSWLHPREPVLTDSSFTCFSARARVELSGENLHCWWLVLSCNSPVSFPSPFPGGIPPLSLNWAPEWVPCYSRGNLTHYQPTSAYIRMVFSFNQYSSLQSYHC